MSVPFDYDPAALDRVRAHVLDRIKQTPAGETPFRHLFIRDILPDDLYAAIEAHRSEVKRMGVLQDRTQDNPAFVNHKFNLFEIDHPVVNCIRDVFSDVAVRTAFVDRFFIGTNDALVDELEIHREFEYFFTEAGRFQNIHVDIPPKCVSFVFYFPEAELTEDEARVNATVLYDRDLAPHYPAALERNSVCVFAPSFHSYHGFSSTVARDVMVMFYISQPEMARYAEVVAPDVAPFTGFLTAIENKLRRHPLIEYGASENRLLSERAACRINAPSGRVMRD